MNHFDSNTRALTLVTDIKGDELETKSYQYPFFVKGIFVKKAIDLGAEFEENGAVVPTGLFDKLTNFVVELYGNEFTEDDLVNGVGADEIIQTYITILMSVLQGEQSKNE